MNYSGIIDCSIVDGEGFRVVLFVSGCNHNCVGCHNPETHDFNYGKKFTDDTYNKLYELLNRPYIKGLTISGGDPLTPDNIKTVLEIINKVKQDFPNKDIWVYTGYEYDKLYKLSSAAFIALEAKYWEGFENLLNIFKKIDVLVDGPFEIDKKDPTLQFRGSSNQRIIDMNKTDKEYIVLWDKSNCYL